MKHTNLAWVKNGDRITACGSPELVSNTANYSEIGGYNYTYKQLAENDLDLLGKLNSFLESSSENIDELQKYSIGDFVYFANIVPGIPVGQGGTPDEYKRHPYKVVKSTEAYYIQNEEYEAPVFGYDATTDVTTRPIMPFVSVQGLSDNACVTPGFTLDERVPVFNSLETPIPYGKYLLNVEVVPRGLVSDLYQVTKDTDYFSYLGDSYCRVELSQGSGQDTKEFRIPLVHTETTRYYWLEYFHLSQPTAGTKSLGSSGSFIFDVKPGVAPLSIYLSHIYQGGSRDINFLNAYAGIYLTIYSIYEAVKSE